ncbi:MAG: hypothetical protein C4316_12720 [Chloroflexota bacterium]
MPPTSPPWLPTGPWPTSSRAPLRTISRFEPVPHLTERYEVNKEATKFTFHLRKGILFHNNQELTAADVAASLRRWGQ